MDKHGLQVFIAWRLPLLEDRQFAIKLVVIRLFPYQLLCKVRDAFASGRCHDLMYEEAI